MPTFNISITYAKNIEAASKEDAEYIIENIASKSNLDDEYGPFNDHWITVDEIGGDDE